MNYGEEIPIQVKDITIYGVERISHKFLDASGQVIEVENSDTVVDKIELKAADDADTTEPVAKGAISMTLFEGEFNKKSDILFPTIHIEEPQPQP